MRSLGTRVLSKLWPLWAMSTRGQPLRHTVSLASHSKSRIIGGIHIGNPSDLRGTGTQPRWHSTPSSLSGLRLQRRSIKQLVEDIAKALVDQPDQVSVQAVERDEATVLELKVAAGDLGKVIGKQGRTARSIRTLLAAASMKFHKRYTLEILE